VNKPANSDIYTTHMAEFVETFARLAVPPSLNSHMFFIEGGALGIENAIKTAFDWKIRKNFAKGHETEKGTQIMHLRECFHGRTGYTLSLTNTDPRKTDLFPRFPWPRIDNPGLRFPVTPEGLADTKAAEERALEQIEQAFADNPDDIAAILIEPIQAEGGDVHFRPEFLRALEQKARQHDVFFVLDEVQTGVGITGRMWAHEHWGLRPDAVAFGKHLLFKESGFKDWWGWLREREWLWARFPPIAGAIGGIARLREAGWYVEAVTSKPKWAEHNVWKWLGHYRPPFNAVTIIDNKQSKVDFTDATVIVDDKLATCQSFNEHGRDAVLFDRHGGYDGQDVFSPFLRQAHNWEAVIAHLEGFRG